MAYIVEGLWEGRTAAGVEKDEDMNQCLLVVRVTKYSVDTSEVLMHWE